MLKTTAGFTASLVSPLGFLMKFPNYIFEVASWRTTSSLVVRISGNAFARREP